MESFPSSRVYEVNEESLGKPAYLDANFSRANTLFPHATSYSNLNFKGLKPILKLINVHAVLNR